VLVKSAIRDQHRVQPLLSISELGYRSPACLVCATCAGYPLPHTYSLGPERAPPVSPSFSCWMRPRCASISGRFRGQSTRSRDLAPTYAQSTCSSCRAFRRESRLAQTSTGATRQLSSVSLASRSPDMSHISAPTLRRPSRVDFPGEPALRRVASRHTMRAPTPQAQVLSTNATWS